VALPGMTGVDHIGFTVPDLDEARTFLVDVLGCEYLSPWGRSSTTTPTGWRTT
jgi:catechol 2,3-dioxygenase-like lactoylglutathione lyase family enzyme